MWPFKRKPKRPVVYWPDGYSPGSLEHAMVQKDVDLFKSISSMPIPDACEAWWAKYPEDFPERGDTLLGYWPASHLIKPKQ